MTVNRNLEATWKYHNATKHSYASVHNNPHFLDWTNQPLPTATVTNGVMAIASRMDLRTREKAGA